MPTQLEAQIAAQKLKLEQLKARQARIEARRRAILFRRTRREDIRRKILVGAIVLARVERGELLEADFRAWMDAGLVRPEDRALFELPPKPPA
jgi:hypothetical protein